MATTSTPQLPPASAPLPSVCTLEDGDHLSAAEFERRFDAMPGLKKAELIEGVVYMPPASDSYHGVPQFNFVTFLGTYAWATPGVRGGDNSTLRLGAKNEPQPDSYLAVQPGHGGQVKLDEHGYVIAAPDLIGEIAASSASYDMHVKKDVYRRHGVKEYVVWRVKERAIDWFRLRDGDYEALPLTDGVFRSDVFPGLWLCVAALLTDDFAQLRKVLAEGIASSEHAAFVAELQKRVAKS